MNSEIIFQKLELLENNEVFRAAMTTADSPEAVLKVLDQYGIEITEQDFLNLTDNVCSNSELDEEYLDSVNGGALAGFVQQLLRKLNGGGNSFGSGGTMGGR